MLSSCLAMAVALTILSIYFYSDSHRPEIVIVALALYMCFFSIGIGPGYWLIPTELFPNIVRAKAVGITTFINRIVASIVASTTLSVAHALTWAGYMLLFAML